MLQERNGAQAACAECENGKCLCSALAEAEQLTLASYTGEPDTVAPVITLRLGADGVAATTDEGVSIVIHRLPQFSPSFVDPGVSAMDDIDGDLTVRGLTSPVQSQRGS
jgi:hypothetical protein